MENDDQLASISEPSEHFYSTRGWILLYLYVAGIDFLLGIMSSISFAFQIHWGNAFLDKIIARASFLSSCLVLVSAIILAIWIYQTSKNSRLAGARGTFKPGGTCVWWIFPAFISILISISYGYLLLEYLLMFGECNLSYIFISTICSILQYLILQELWKTSIDPVDWKDIPDSPRITCWLVLTLLFSFVFPFLSRIIYPWGVIVNCINYLAILLLLISTMRTISSRQSAYQIKSEEKDELTLD